MAMNTTRRDFLKTSAAGAAVGTAAYQERGVQGVARDMATATRMRTKLLDAGEKYVTGVGVEVYEGRILLTGARGPSSWTACLLNHPDSSRGRSLS